MEPAHRASLVEALASYDYVVEIGIGHRTEIAAELVARGTAVTATDIHHRTVPDGVRFVLDDLTDPAPGVYEGADAIYGLSLPPELHRPAYRVARRYDADLLFTTLGTDPPAIPADPETIPGGTLFRARTDSDGPSL